MKYVDLQAHLKKRVESVYTLAGGDSYLIKSARDMIERALGITNIDFNYTRLSGDTTISKIISECSTALCFSEKRMVYVCGFLQSALTKSEREMWSAYLKNPVESTCLVISLENGGVLPEATTVDCGKPEESDAARMIIEYLNSKGKTIAESCALTLVNYVRRDMNSLYNEADKLCAYSGERITVDDVNALVVRSEEYEFYELANKVGKKDTKGALKVIDYLLRRGEEPSHLCSLLYSTVRRMFYISLNKEMKNEEFAVHFGIKPYAVSKLRESVSGFTSAKLLKAVGMCLDADIEMKNITQKENRLFLLVTELIAL